MTQTSELSTLISYLNQQRRHAVGILDGAAESDLRRAVLPTGWSCLGMIRHLTFDIERFWFSAVLAGDQAAIEELATGENYWNVDPNLAADAIFARYQTEIERSNAVLAELNLDASPKWWPKELFGEWRLETNRQVVMHVMTEVACHTGHLDVVRELIDGRTWLILTN